MSPQIKFQPDDVQLQAKSKPTPKPKSKSKSDPNGKTRSTQSRIYSFLYHTTFYLFVLLLSILLAGGAAALGEQAWRNVDERKWDVVVISAAYAALGLSAIVHVWSRRLSVRQILRTMPKPYIPTKQMDIPKKVADHIMTQYTRTAVIAHISQATTGQQEGWGRPGTKWENQHFRTYILATLPVMHKALLPHTPLFTKKAVNLADLVQAGIDYPDTGALRLFVNSYVKILERCRYGNREPDEGDAVACDKIVDVVLVTLELKRRREHGMPITI